MGQSGLTFPSHHSQQPDVVVPLTIHDAFASVLYKLVKAFLEKFRAAHPYGRNHTIGQHQDVQRAVRIADLASARGSGRFGESPADGKPCADEL